MPSKPPAETAFDSYLLVLLAAGFVRASDEYRRARRFTLASEVYRYCRGETTLIVAAYRDHDGVTTCADLVVEVGRQVADSGTFLHETAGAPLGAREVDRLRHSVAQYL